MLTPLLTALWLVSATQVPSCSEPTATFRVESAGPDRFTITGRFLQPARQLALREMRSVDRPEGLAESVKSLRGWSADGEPVDLTYAGHATWQAAGGRSISRVRYELAADHDAANWSDGGSDEVAARFDAVNFFVGYSFFLIDPDWAPCSVRILFDLPDDWTIVAPWPGDQSTRTAADPMSLWFNAFAVGRHSPGRADAGGMQLEWVIDSGLREVEPQLTELLQRLPPIYADYFGGVPARRYSVVAFGHTFTDGGAFRQSFALRIATPPRAIDQTVWTHVLGHEVLHLWLGNYIRGNDPSQTDWFTEGFTDYLTVKLMYFAGLSDESILNQRLANVIRRYLLGRRLSPGVGLIDAGRNKSANWELIYGGGALVALLLDADLAGQPGAFTTALRHVFQGAGEPYTVERLLATLDASTDGRASRIVREVDAGLPLGAIARRLATRGIDVTGFTADEIYVAAGTRCDRPSCARLFPASVP